MLNVDASHTKGVAPRHMERPATRQCQKSTAYPSNVQAYQSVNVAGIASQTGSNLTFGIFMPNQFANR